MRTGVPSTVRLSAIFASVALVLVLAFGITGQAQAAQGRDQLIAGDSPILAQDDESDDVSEYDEDPTPQLGSATLWAGDDSIESVGNFVEYSDYVYNVVSVKSSNTKVLKIVKEKGLNSGDIFAYSAKPLKAGKSTITITYKNDGVTKTMSNIFTVKKYPNAIKSIKLNGKKLSVPTAKNLTHWQNIYSFKGKKAKVDIKLAKGWKIESMAGFAYKSGAMESEYEFPVANGKSFKLPKKKNASIDFYIVKDNGNGTSERFNYGLGILREKPLDLRKDLTVYTGYPLSGKTTPYYLFLTNDAKVKITKVTSSKPKVLSVKCGKKPSSLKLTGKKPGKSKVTIKYSYKGKKYTAKATYVVSRPPVSSLIVNGKKAKTKHENGYYLNNYKKDSVTLKVVPGKGWKIKSIMYYNGATEENMEVKNGASIETPGGAYTGWTVTLKKGKKTFNYYVDIDRP